MVDWNSAEELGKDAAAFSYFVHMLAGAYLWEFFVSLPFEWSLISGKLSFRRPLLFYFVGRYSLLGALVGIIVSLHVTSGVNCQALYTVIQLLGNIAIGSASINLSMRTIAVWMQNKWIISLIVLLILGHWGLLLRGILQVQASLIPGAGCVITATNDTILVAVYVYTMIFDFIVMCLTAVKLAFPTHGGGRSRLVNLIFTDGLIYFMISFSANVIATTFMVLDLNSVMSIIFDIPTVITTTILACRVVRRLTEFNTCSPEVFQSSEHNSAPMSTGRIVLGRSGQATTLNRAPPGSVHVNVRMDTFTIHDSLPSPRENDAGHPKDDIEAQDNSYDVKRSSFS